ncbi:MAG: hypothetical protein Q9226_005612 [Calogaya cf. arnoldii]
MAYLRIIKRLLSLAVVVGILSYILTLRKSPEANLSSTRGPEETHHLSNFLEDDVHQDQRMDFGAFDLGDIVSKETFQSLVAEMQESDKKLFKTYLRLSRINGDRVEQISERFEARVKEIQKITLAGTTVLTLIQKMELIHPKSLTSSEMKTIRNYRWRASELLNTLPADKDLVSKLISEFDADSSRLALIRSRLPSALTIILERSEEILNEVRKALLLIQNDLESLVANLRIILDLLADIEN